MLGLPTWTALPAAFAGCLWGIFGGALPGISPSIAMALLLPLTYGMDPVPAIVLLASVYVGAEYGGSIPAILIRTPGTNASAATTLDGYTLARQGRAGEALGISLVCGLGGGLVGLVFLVLATEPLAALALNFTPPAYFALAVLGLSVIAGLASGSLLKGFLGAGIGLAIATIGTDPVSGVPRFTLGEADLLAGIRPILVMVGLFAVAEMLAQISEPPWARAEVRDTRLKLPSFAVLRKTFRAQAIGWGIGTFEGVTPGAGGTVAAFMAYNEARRWSKEPEKFGHGSEEGIAAPEAANNVVTATALVPLLSLGIPGSNSAAILLGGFLIHGLTPGPLLFAKAPDVVTGLYWGLLFANIAMLLLGLVILTPAIWLVNRPKPYLLAGILCLVVSGVFAIEQNLFDVGLVLGFGVLGYLLRLAGVPMLPMVLGVVLGFMLESNFRRSLVLSGGDPMIFLQDRISLVLLLLAAGLTAWSAAREFKKSPAKDPA